MTSRITDRDGIRKVAELIKDIRLAMLVTIDDRGRPQSRPMQTQDVEFDGTIWFFTDVQSDKVAEITANPRVNVAYASSSERYVSVTGMAAIVQDPARTHELWNPLLRAWFDSADDPRIRLVRIDAESAEYWDTPGGKVASLISLVKSAVTGTPDTSGENHTVQM